jgi:hypothetical protein
MEGWEDVYIKLMKSAMLNEVSQIQKDEGCIFSLIYGRQIQIHIQVLSYICIKICMYITYFKKVELLDEAKRGGKEEKIDRENNIGIHHICVGTRHNEMY